MKPHYLILASLLSTCWVFGQNTIPNASFEDWNGNTPTNWSTNNNGSVVTITKVNDGFEGAYAVRGTVVQGQNTVSQSPMLQSTDGNFGFPVDSRFDQLTLHYQSFLYAGDRFNINVAIYDQTFAMVGGGSASLSNSISTYTALTIPITHFASGAAYASISFTIVDGIGMTNGHVLSWFQVDALGGPATMTNLNSTAVSWNYDALQIATNNREVEVIVSQSGTYHFEVYSLIGQQIAQLQTTLVAGNHQRIVCTDEKSFPEVFLLRTEKDGVPVDVRKIVR